MASVILYASKESRAKCVFSALGNLRKRAELCDVKITVKDKCIAAHRVVLAAVFPYFRHMFVRGVTGMPKEEQVTINEIDQDALETLIHYAYGKQLKITAENVQTLFLTSDFLDLMNVKVACAEFMKKHLRIEEVVEARNFAECASSKNLMTCCDNYIMENIEALFKSKALLSLPFSVLRDIMKGMAFYRIFKSETVCEKKLFEVIVAWIKVSQAMGEERERMLFELFSYIQLERFSLDYLCENIASEHLIKSSRACMELVEKAKIAYVPCSTLSVYSGIFYRSLRKTFHKWKFSNLIREIAAVYAVCCSKTFGLYVRFYNGKENKWVTPTPSIQAESCFKHIICRGTTIEILGTSTFWAFDTLSLKWSESEQPFPVFHKALAHGNKTYVFDDDPCSSNESFISNNDIKTISKDTAVVHADANCTQIIMPSVASLEDYIYISGGQLEGKCVNLFQKYCPETDTWTQLPPMPTRRCGHISAVLNDRIYACGGMNDLQENLNIVEAFDVDENQWLLVSPMNVPRSRFSLVSAGKNLYAACGAENTGPMYSFEIFDPKFNEWKYAAPIYVWDEVGETNVKITSLDEYDY